MKKILTLALLSVVAGSGAIATSANAATLIVNSDGKLTGATGVTIGTKTYDVAFKDGTCAQAYGTCEKTSFDFTTQEEATAASQALLDQVLIDGPAGNFDNEPSLVFGCRVIGVCFTQTAFDQPFSGGVTSIHTINRNDYNILDLNTVSSDEQVDGMNFARFTLVPDSVTSAVPEPASWAMMIGGFGMVGGLMRRRRARAAFA